MLWRRHRLTDQTLQAQLDQLERNQRVIMRLLSRMTSTNHQQLPLKEAAVYLGYSPHYLRHLAVDKKQIKFNQPGGPGGKLFFDRCVLDSFLGSSIS